MFDLNFSVNENWLKYFKNKLSKKTELRIIKKDSEYLRDYLESLWKNNESEISKILWKFFENDTDVMIEVEVYPRYFYLWAINITRWIIILWQPELSKSHYISLLCHEIVHFILKNQNLSRISEEIISFMFERLILEKLDNVSFADISYSINTDSFHKKAIWYANDLYPIFLEFYVNNDLDWLLSFLEKNIKESDKNIIIPSNITSYLNSING